MNVATLGLWGDFFGSRAAEQKVYGFHGHDDHAVLVHVFDGDVNFKI